MRYRAAAPAAAGAALAAQAEPTDDGAIPRVVLAHQVRKEAATLANELEEAAARVVILGKGPEMLREARDPLGEKRDLHLRRARVALDGGVLRDDLFLRLPRE